MKAIIISCAFAVLSAISGIAHAADDYQGWWWDASKNGMGLNIAKQNDTMAVAWYNFDNDRSSSYVLFAAKVINGVLVGDLQKASGPPPGPGYDPAQVTRRIAGKGTIRFTSTNTAIFDYTLDGQSGSMNLTRFDVPDESLPSWWSYSIAGRVCGYETGGIVDLTRKGDRYDLVTVDHYTFPRCTYSSVSAIPGSTATYRCELDQYGNAESGQITTNRLQIDNNSLVFEFSSQPSLSLMQKCVFGNIQRVAGTRFIKEENVLNGWWWDSAKDGMGVNIEQKGGTIALAWYHFDANHLPAYALLVGSNSASIEDELNRIANEKVKAAADKTGSTKVDPFATVFKVEGALQGASGPPPGPGYNPDSVVREEIGQGTLSIKRDTRDVTLPPFVTFSYRLNGKEQAALNLAPFIMQGMLPPFSETWAYTANHVRPEEGPTYYQSLGTVTLVKAGGNAYLLTTNNGSECKYALFLNQVGSTFSGNGYVECGEGDSVRNGDVLVSRLITAWDTLTFDYHVSWNESGYSGETVNLVGIINKDNSIHTGGGKK